MKNYVYTVSSEDAGKRLDTYVSGISGLPRSGIQTLIKDKELTVNDKVEKSSHKVKQDDIVQFSVRYKPVETLDPEDIPIDVIWQDNQILVVNKPAGMVIYPAPGNYSGTLMNAVVNACDSLSSIGAPLRPGVIHRLDKDTSGVIVIARTDEAYHYIIDQFKTRQTEKHYIALVHGRLKKDRDVINKNVGRSLSDRKKMSVKTGFGKEAISEYEVLQRFSTATLVRVKIITGRTHQIRVHFASIGFPILGDSTYGQKTSIRLGSRTIVFRRQMLHANSLKLRHPETKEITEFIAPIPDDINKAIQDLSIDET
ncbi:MAG: RluA family pseudouridine synthase [Nitrospira sp.]|nr:RluA family pseudouridine synthase [Nitrospira sp.]